MSNKINVLVLPSDKSGVGKFRSVDPHIHLQNLYPNDFHIDIDYEPKINDYNYWKKYQIVHAHRNIGQNYENTPNLIKMLRQNGIIVIIDIDDYWLPTKEHPIHQLIVTNKKRVMSQQQPNCLHLKSKSLTQMLSFFQMPLIPTTHNLMSQHNRQKKLELVG